MSVRHALLALLCEGPKYGLQLHEEFEAGTGEMWPLNVGQVYTTLQRLERSGQVESADEGDGPQKLYRLTDTGRAELADWFEPPRSGGPPRDELVIKVLVGLRVPTVDVRDVIQAHRRWIVEEMQTFTRLKGELRADEVSALLVCDAEIFRLDAVARWLDAAEARLRTVAPPAGSPSVPTANQPRAVRPRARAKAAAR